MLLTLIVFLLILSVLIFVHELGHFLVAKRAGIKVEEFGLGLPPRVWGKKIGETIYSLNLLPIGGFVKLYGEDGGELKNEKTEKLKDTGRQFCSKPKKVRAAVTIAGVVMNFLLAVTIFSFLYTKLGIPTPTGQVAIKGVKADSPAQEAGIRQDDVIITAAGKSIKETKEFIEITQEYAGQQMPLEVRREGENLLVSVTPRQEPPEGEGPLGIEISSSEIRFYPFWEMPFRGAFEGLKESLAWMAIMITVLGTMFYQLVTAGTTPADLAGPVGIFQVTGEVAKTGSLSILRFLGILSLNLAVVNLLPLPALDGGRLLFIAIETVLRRRVQAKIEAYAHQLGFIFVLLLLVLVTFNDLRRILGTTSFLERLRQFLP